MSTPSVTSRPEDLEAWDEAFRRVESYLRALGIESRVQLNLLTTDIITAAQRSAVDREAAEPVTLAMQEANARINAWFQRMLGAEPEHSEAMRFHARGRLALIMAEVPARWPKFFLSEEALPPELTAAVSACAVQAGPEVRFKNMAPQPIEFSSGPRGGAPQPDFPRASLMRAAALWGLIVGLLGVTWAASHR